MDSDVGALTIERTRVFLDINLINSILVKVWTKDNNVLHYDIYSDIGDFLRLPNRLIRG